MNNYNDILNKYYGYNQLKPEQYQIINTIINDKRDVCGVLATGFGKSICYQLPYLITNKSVIVISPLIALMEDQKSDMIKKNINVVCLNSSNKNKDDDIDKIIEGDNKLIYTSPEYIVNNGQELINILYENNNICCFAIDEAHCISSYGNDFRSNYKELNCLRKWAPNIPILSLTATATQKVVDDIINGLQLNNPLMIKSSFDRPNLYIEVNKKSKSIADDIMSHLIKHENDNTIIYVKTRDETEKICILLSNRGLKVKAYHAGLTTNIRKNIQNEFIQGKFNIIISTIAFGLGINQKINLVIHYGCPTDLEGYYQEIGRAGRDGSNSECIMYYSSKDFGLNKFFIKDIEDQQHKKYKSDQIFKIEKYTYSDSCRRKYILEHFGEKTNYSNCNNCDNCLKKSVNKIDVSNELLLLLRTVNDTKNKYGINTIILILRGSKSKKITNEMTKLFGYNKGISNSDNWWKELIKRTIAIGYLNEKSIDNSNFGSSLNITQNGYKWYNENKANIQNKVLFEMINQISKSVNKPTKTNNLSNNKPTNEEILDMFIDD